MPPTPVVPLAIVSPVRDEGKYVRNTLDAMVAQTVQPQEWLFVDDGSTDDTRAIIETYAAKHPWIRVISRDDRGFRQLGSGVIAAFDYGRARLARQDYQYIAKLDGDMSFTPRYLEVMIGRLESEPKLAAVSGKVFRPESGGFVEEYIIDEMVAGQFKLYKRVAFEAIGGFTQTILWDGIDIHRCRMKGYTHAVVPSPGRETHPPPADGFVRQQCIQGSRAARARHLVHGVSPAVRDRLGAVSYAREAICHRWLDHHRQLFLRGSPARGAIRRPGIHPRTAGVAVASVVDVAGQVDKAEIVMGSYQTGTDTR